MFDMSDPAPSPPAGDADGPITERSPGPLPIAMNLFSETRFGRGERRASIPPPPRVLPPARFHRGWLAAAAVTAMVGAISLYGIWRREPGRSAVPLPAPIESPPPATIGSAASSAGAVSSAAPSSAPVQQPPARALVSPRAPASRPQPGATVARQEAPGHQDAPPRHDAPAPQAEASAPKPDPQAPALRVATPIGTIELGVPPIKLPGGFTPSGPGVRGEE